MPEASACDRCPQPSVAWLRYSGERFCGDHLRDSVERRVKRELKRQGGLPKGRVAVAYSGGKDSTTVLHLVHDLVSERRDTELIAVTIDEGIQGYRPASLEIARRVTQRLGVEHVIKRTQDLMGATMDEIHARDAGLGACSYCGVSRRRLMNDAARELGATRLVTGHNLDDTAQSILMNLTTADLDKLAKIGPHESVQPGLVPRLLPLRVIPEAEVYLYAHLRGLEWHDEECPYAAKAARGVYRDILYRLEEARPGTRHSLLRTLDSLRPVLGQVTEMAPIGTCVSCGEPTSGTVCKVCQMRMQIPQRAG